MQGVGGSSPLVFTTSEQAFYRLLRFFVKIEAYSCLYFSFLQSVTLSARLFCCKYSYDGTQLLPVFCGLQGLALLSAINKKYFSCTCHINKRGHRKDNLSCYFLYSLIVLGLRLFYDDDIGIYEYFFISVAYFHTVGHCAVQPVHIFFDSLFDFYKITLKFLLFVSAGACAHNKDP